MKKATPEQAVAATTVFWDINRCPVPLGFDARQVGPSIKRFLKNLGFSGPLTIKAIGILTHVPEGILRAVSSTGIVLNHVPLGSQDIESLLHVWTMKNKSPANVMVISTPPSYSSTLSFLSKLRRNVIYPFRYDFPREPPSALSLWNDFLLADSEAPEEDKSSETGDALWDCCVCQKHDGRGFENFIYHLSGRQHRVMLPIWFSDTAFEAELPFDSYAPWKDTPEEAVAVAATTVFWDINRCPVPLGFDAHQVGPLIKQFLENLGYSGPLTITAVGILTHVPEDILRAVSSTGIVLNHVPCGSKDMERLLSRCSVKGKSPAAANVMVITTPPSYSSILSTLSERGLNVIYPFPYEEKTPTYAANVRGLWINYFLWIAPDALEEDKCRETGESASWVCLVCHNDGRGFDNFITHLSSRKHAQELPRWFSEFDKKVLEERAEAYLKAKEKAKEKAKAKTKARARARARAKSHGDTKLPEVSLYNLSIDGK